MQVASIDTLLARDRRPPATLIVYDECHHAAADTYRTVLDAYPDVRMLGLTATPQRGDGRALGDLFQALVVGARYPELIAAGHLVPCRVFRPPEYLGSDLAREPLSAWQHLQRAGLDGQAFAFARDVKQAREQTAAFNAAGIPSAVVTGLCGSRSRAEALARFRSGAVRVLWNVFVLTEGVDVPDAAVCLLARGCGNAGTYLQMVGRVLRPAGSGDGRKTHAVLVDLPGVSHVHGLPTADREYALDGRPIRVVGESLRNCPQCGHCQVSALPACESCGYEWPRVVRARPKVWDMELAEAIEAAGGDAAAVGEEWRVREWDRLRAVCRGKGFALWFAVKEFRALFGVEPDAALMARCDEAERIGELKRLMRLQAERGFKKGFAAVRYKALFSAWPRKEWMHG